MQPNHRFLGAPSPSPCIRAAAQLPAWLCGGRGSTKAVGGGAHTLHPKGPCPTRATASASPAPCHPPIHPPPRPQGSRHISQPLHPPAFLFLSAGQGPFPGDPWGWAVGPCRALIPLTPEPPLRKGAPPQASPGPVCRLGLSPVPPLGPHGPQGFQQCPLVVLYCHVSTGALPPNLLHTPKGAPTHTPPCPRGPVPPPWGLLCCHIPQCLGVA